MKFKVIFSIGILILSAGAVQAEFEVGQDVFRRYQELASEGFSPLAGSGVANHIVSMHNQQDLYLCFLADDEEKTMARQNAIIGHMQGGDVTEVPNIPLVCVRAE